MIKTYNFNINVGTNRVLVIAYRYINLVKISVHVMNISLWRLSDRNTLVLLLVSFYLCLTLRIKAC